jgi:hypothetical protein
MTASHPVAVVATSVARTDRRALSQAWYSALHLAEPHAGSPHAASAGAHANAVGPHAANHTPAAGPAPASGGARQIARPLAARGAGALPVLDRRSPATPLAKRIARALVEREPRPAPATLAIKAAEGRVQLLVRSDGAATRIVALCAPALRERVERALAHARFALAAHGTRVEAAS